MRITRPASLVLASLTILVACGDDNESTTSSGSGGGSSSDASSTSSGTGDASSSASGSDASTSSAGGTGGEGGGGGEGGAGGGEPLEVIEGPGFRSGDRLRPVYLDGGDGARQLLRWYDTEIEAYCTFGADSPADDAFSCFPGGGSIAFTDEACTQPVFIASADDCDARFASAYDEWALVFANAGTAQVGGARTLHERGAPIATPKALFRRSHSGCYPQELDDGETVHEARVATISLVAATLDIEPLADGLARGVVHAEDGAQQLLGEYDEASGTRCQYLGDNAEGEWGCLPAIIAELVSPTHLNPPGYHNLYVDDGCSVPGGVIFPADMPVPSLPYIVGLGDAQFEIAAYELGPEVDTFYSTITLECAEREARFRVYEVGERLDVTFPSVLFSAVFPIGRLAGIARGSADGDLLTTLDAFADTEADDAECELLVFPEEDADGDAPFRCVTGVAGLRPTHHDHYADAACTEPLYAIDPVVRYRTDGVELACASTPRRDEAREVLRFEAWEGDVFELGETCLSVERGEGPWSREVAVTPSDFPAIVLVDPAAHVP